MAKAIIIVLTFLAVSITTFLMLVLNAFLTDSIQTNSVFAFIGYFFVTLYFAKISKDRLSALSILVVVLTSMLLMQSYTIYLYFVESITFSPLLPIYFMAIVSAHLYSKLSWPNRILPFFLCSLVVGFMFFEGWDLWIHRANFGTFTGKVKAYDLPARFEAFDEKGILINADSFQNKVVLLDFWYTGCGACFEKFPQVEAAYEKYKNNPTVAIFAVDTPIEEDKSNQAFEMIRAEGYTFPVLIAKDENLPDNFGVKGYPTTFVIDNRGMIVFKGTIEGGVKMVEELR